MTKANIYQIFYSEETRARLDSGFIPLDNTGQRPDWYEYWPIRNFLINNELNEDEYYGFLSPRFQEKTCLTSQQVYSFVESVQEPKDILLIPPFFDVGALYENVFVQGAIAHPGIWDAFVHAVKLLAPEVTDLRAFITDSTNTVFCNYFLAKPRFWRRWLDKAETIFEIAEHNCTTFGRALTADTSYGGRPAPVKIFVIERIASLLLATEAHWRVGSVDPTSLPLLFRGVGSVSNELIAMDALKMAFAKTSRREYALAYGALRQRVVPVIEAGRAKPN